MSRRAELELAIEAAEAAGVFLTESKAAGVEVISAEGKDIKLRADREAEKVILDRLQAESDYPILTEETGEHGELGSGPFWVVDPLDGSMNYSRDLPICCVSIALYEADEPLLGVIRDFNRDETFSAVAGEGARCGDAPISVSSITRPEEAVISTGFPSYRDFGEEALRDFVVQVQRFKKIRMIGSAALSLAYVACGRLDAYGEDDIMLWDVAAGIALVRAAGGYVEVEKSARHKWGLNVRCASSPALWNEK